MVVDLITDAGRKSAKPVRGDRKFSRSAVRAAQHIGRCYKLALSIELPRPGCVTQQKAEMMLRRRTLVINKNGDVIAVGNTRKAVTTVPTES